jgi:hypothetical protein
MELVTGALDSCAQQIKEIEHRNPSQAGSIFSDFFELLKGAIKEEFQVLLEIGSENPEYAHPDPANWVEGLVRKDIHESFRYEPIPEDIDFKPTLGVLGSTIIPAVAREEVHFEGDTPPETVILTDFFLDIDAQLRDLVCDANVQLARRGWKPPETKSPAITPAPSEADTGPRAGLSGTPQHNPNAPSAPLRYVWYQDPASGVWTISVPPNPGDFLHMQHCVGLRYIQVALREYPKELEPSRIQALAGAEIDSGLPLAEPPRLDASIDDEHGGRRRIDGFSSYETPEETFNKEGKAKIEEELRHFRDEIEEARSNNDQARVSYWTEQMDELLEFVRRDTDHRGRPRILNPKEKHPADSVRNGIKRAIAKISKSNPNVGQFLKDNITKTGSKVSYSGPEVEWRFYK